MKSWEKSKVRSKKKSNHQQLFEAVTRIAWFYGWEEETILNLTPRKFWAYYSYTNVISAQEHLKLISAIMMPRMKNNRDRKRIVDIYSQIADPDYAERQEKENDAKIKFWQARFGKRKKVK